MKVVTVLGTRPEIIRLSRVIAKLDQLVNHVLVHTGQNHDPGLSDVFFQEMGVRQPDHYLGARGRGFGDQVGQILSGIEPILQEERPDRLLILGDTNSGIAALVAKRQGVPVYHMEAGNRCFDDRVPEEVNRRVIDHSSDVLMPYTENSRNNLLREGISPDRIYVTGNPILEVLNHYRPQADTSTVHADLGVEPGRFLLVTLHRAENVDVESRLRSFTRALDTIQREYAMPVLISLHPRTRSKLEAFGLRFDNDHVRLLAPLGLFDFVALERSAFCVLSDSGTVQEECCIFRVPNVTLRDVTERPETLECGSNMLTGADAEQIRACVRAVADRPREWRIPPEYLAENVSDTVIKILLGFRLPRVAI